MMVEANNATLSLQYDNQKECINIHKVIVRLCYQRSGIPAWGYFELTIITIKICLLKGQAV